MMEGIKMKKLLSLFTVLALVLNMGMTVLAQGNQDNNILADNATQRIYIEDNESDSLMDIDYIDLDYWFNKVPGTNTYELYATISSNEFLTNYIKSTYSVVDTSFFFPDTYMYDTYISKAYPATKHQTLYIGSFTVPSDVDKVKVVQENLQIYNLSKAMWVNFGNWSGALSLPKY